MSKIAIDARFYNEAGPGRYCKNIIKSLEKLDVQNQYVVFLRKKNYDAYIPENPNIKKVLADVSWYSWAEQVVFLLDVLAERPDILYVPHFNIPVLYPGKIVTAVADIIMHQYSTEKATTLPKFYFTFKKFVYQLVIQWVFFRSYKVIVPSESVKKEFIQLKKYLSVSPDKFVVAHEGVDPDFSDVRKDTKDILSSLGIYSPYILYVSSMYPHKNTSFLLKGFANLLATIQEDTSDTFSIILKQNLKLVLVGKKDNFSKLVAQEVSTLGLEDKVIMPGEKRYINDSEISILRKNSEFVVFPSLKEGFSLTPLESQALGVPCLISNIEVHQEIYGDSVEYCDPYNLDDFVAKIVLLLTNPTLKSNLVKKGYENVKRYDWLKTAQITLNVFNELKGAQQAS